jgi:hypothetical protein
LTTTSPHSTKLNKIFELANLLVFLICRFVGSRKPLIVPFQFPKAVLFVAFVRSITEQTPHLVPYQFPKSISFATLIC